MPDLSVIVRPLTFELGSALESKEPDRQSPEAYRELVKSYYNGKAGWFTVLTGFVTGHESLADHVFAPDAFDVRGCQRLLDVGCGNGRYLRFLLKQADPQATLVGCDLAAKMLWRTRQRLKSDRADLLTADLTRLPYADESFDAIVCGWVIEHLQEPIAGLRELARVLAPGGKCLLMTTEQTLLGAICSRTYHCRTYRRRDLRTLCEQTGLQWHREHSWSLLHRLCHCGGIVVELRRSEASGEARA
jgi:ubiquinone/menaquinone biosynthesis C-methylase UbiE